jgi:hypothetical protein
MAEIPLSVTASVIARPPNYEQRGCRYAMAIAVGSSTLSKEVTQLMDEVVRLRDVLETSAQISGSRKLGADKSAYV